MRSRSMAWPFVALFMCASAPAGAPLFGVTNLVIDNQSTNAAQLTDPNLVNPWGIAFSPTGPIRVSDNGTGVATVYTINSTTNATLK